MRRWLLAYGLLSAPSAVSEKAFVYQLGPDGPNEAVWTGHDDDIFPAARSGASAIVQPSGAVWLFGGSAVSRTGAAGNPASDQLWELRVTTLTTNWSKVGGSGISGAFGRNGARGVASVRNWPGSRSGHASWLAGGGMYIFGGSGYTLNSRGGSSYGRLSDIWLYQAGSWTWLGGPDAVGARGIYPASAGAPPNATLWPGARSGHIMQPISPGIVVLFGGSGFGSNAAEASPQQLNDLWKWNATSSLWQFLGGSTDVRAVATYAASGGWPGAREGHVHWASGTAGVCVFGGLGYGATSTRGMLNDLWCWQDGDTEWVLLGGSNGTATPAVYTGAEAWPGGMYGAAAAALNSSAVWVFGGYGMASASSGSEGTLNALWFWGGSTTAWKMLGGSQETDYPGVYGQLRSTADAAWPGGRQDAALWLDEDGALWLFGGSGRARGGTSPGILADLWSFVDKCEHVDVLNSPTACTVGAGMSCVYSCNDGYAVGGLHTCVSAVATGGQAELSGGSCIAATCAAPSLGAIQMVRSGCVDGGALGTSCDVGCIPGYRKVAGMPNDWYVANNAWFIAVISTTPAGRVVCQSCLCV